MNVRKVALLGGIRTPFARSMTHYLGVSHYDLMKASVQALVHRFQILEEELGEVVIGSVMKHSKDWNLAREVTIGSGLSSRTPAFDIQKACATSLEAAITVGNKIALGQIEVGLAGGVDTNSNPPIVFSKSFVDKMLKVHRAKYPLQKLGAVTRFRIRDFFPVLPSIVENRTKLSMGQSCEQMAKEWKLEQFEQNEVALESHQKASMAYDEAFYDDLLVPWNPWNKLTRDACVRKDTSMRKLSSLKPVFDRKNGTLTAGNSSPLTDGSACVLLSSESWAKERGIPIQAYLSHVQSAAVNYMDEEGLLMAPVYAVARLLKQANLKLQDFDFYEIHEAFAAQLLCHLKAWESSFFCKEKLGLSEALGSIPRNRINVKGGSVALGHPFAATGARILASLGKILSQEDNLGKRGLISVCTAGGMGVAAILES